MRQRFVAFALAFAVAGLLSPQAFAQSKTARGTVTAMAADTVTVKVANVDMTFNVDGKTSVTAVGAGTKDRAAQKAGAAGPKLGDVIKVGQAVQVSYTDAGGKLHASSIRAVASAGGADASAPSAKTSAGTVQTISGTSLTVAGSGSGGVKFTQTFTIDSATKVVGKGAGTAAAAKGGRTAITDLVAAGDTVSVSYKEMGTMLHASEVRVTLKATK